MRNAIYNAVSPASSNYKPTRRNISIFADKFFAKIKTTPAQFSLIKMTFVQTGAQKGGRA